VTPESDVSSPQAPNTTDEPSGDATLADSHAASPRRSRRRGQAAAAPISLSSTTSAPTAVARSVRQPFHSRGTRPATRPRVLPDDFEVERILDKGYDDQGNPVYLVKWLGYTKRYATWEPLAHLNGCADKLHEFEKRAALVHRP